MQPQAASAVINIMINANTAQSGAAGFQRIMNGITNSARQSAQDSALSWNNIFGANFFADLAAGFVRAMLGGFRQVVSAAIDAAARTESAFAGLGSTARNLGFSELDTTNTVKNLDLVQKGLLNVGEAAQSMKNLLATGFDVSQSTEIIKRFGDTAAFGRQASLSFGYAIASATEGIKNQNSILVDNAGLTKNLSVILKERGFQIQDLSDKVKGAAAREALYAGLLQESAVQMGDSNRLLETTQGQMLRVDAAQTRVLVGLGELITKSSLMKTALSALVTVLDVMAQSPQAVVALAAAVGILTVAIIAMNSASISAMPVIGGLISSFSLMGKVMTGTASLMAGATATTVLATAGWAALAIGLAAVTYAVYSYATAETKSQAITTEAIKHTLEQRKAYQLQVSELDKVSAGNVGLNSTQKMIEAGYRAVDVEAQKRITTASTEAEKIAILREEYVRLAKSQDTKLETQSRLVGTDYESKLNELDALDKRQKQLAQNADNAQAALNRMQNRPAGAGIDPDELQGAIAMKRAADAKFSELNATLYGDGTSAGAVAEAKNLVSQLQALAQARQTDVDTIIRQKYAYEGHADQADAAIARIRVLEKQFGLTAAATDKGTAAIQSQIDKYGELVSASERVEFRQKYLAKLIQDTADEAIQQGSSPEDAAKRAVENLKLNKALNPQISNLQNYQQQYLAASKAATEFLDLKPDKEKKIKTEMESLTDAVRKMKGEVKGFSDLTSKEFKLRFEREELERVKRDFENILTLRRELGLPLKTQLPTTAEAARAELERLERVKRLRDDILKLGQEQQAAEDKLMLAQLGAISNVVDAQTRADTAYFEGLRKRADAEQQLTADIAGEYRRRDELAAKSVRDQFQFEAETYKDFLVERNAEVTDQMKAIARLQASGGAGFTDNPLVNAARGINGGAGGSTPFSPVVQRLDTSNGLLKEILDAVKSSNLSGASNVINSVSSVSAANSKGASIIRASKILGVNPQDLAAIIGYESAGTFSPAKWGGKGGNYLGLIQFGANERRDYGANANQTFDEQMDAVIRFLQDRTKKYGGTQGLGVEGLYRTINGGNPRKSLDASDGNGTIRQHIALINSRKALYGRKVFNQAIESPTDVPTAQIPYAATYTAEPQLPARARVVQLPTRDRVNRTAAAATEFFGLPDASRESLSQLTPQSVEALQAYLDAQRQFSLQTRAQALSVDRLNQSQRVNNDQTRELEISERRLVRLLGGDSLSVREVLNDAEIERNRNAEKTQAALIATNAYLDKLRAGDPNVFAQILTEADAQRAQETAKAFEQIAQNSDWLEKYRNGDAETLENLRKLREAQRGGQEKALTVEVDNLRDQASKGGRDAALERLQLQKEYYGLIVDTGQAQAKLEQQRALFGDASYTANSRLNDVLGEQKSLERDLWQLENDRATGEINQALRVRVAREKELAAIRNEDFKAQERIAAAEVRAGDANVLHRDQVRAGILEHINGVNTLTETYTNFVTDGIDVAYNGVDSLFGLMTSKIPVVGGMIQDLLSSLAKLAINKIFLRMMFPESAQNISAGSAGGILSGGGGGATGGGGLSGILQGLFGGLGRGGISGGASTPPYFPPSQVGGGINPLALLGMAGGGGSSSLPTLTSTMHEQAQLASTLGMLGMGGATRARIVPTVGGATRDRVVSGMNNASLMSQLFGGIGFGKTAGSGGALASMLPLLGLSAGSSLAGGSRLGSILGGAGGLALGVGLTAAPTFLAGSFLAPLFSNPITAVVGGALLVGGLLWSRSAKRRKEEEQRSAILVDSKQQLQKIIDDLRANPSNYENALAQAMQVRDSYMAQVGQLKDSKTRRIAEQTVRELDSMINNQLKPEIANAKNKLETDQRRNAFAQAQENAFVPTFAFGGGVGYVSGLAGSGNRTSDDNVWGLFNKRETVITPENVYNLGGYERLRQAGVRGSGFGNPNNAYDAYSPRQSASSSGGMGDMQILAFADEASADAWMSNAKPRTVAKKMKVAIVSGDDDGYLKTSKSKMSGTF